MNLMIRLLMSVQCAALYDRVIMCVLMIQGSRVLGFASTVRIFVNDIQVVVCQLLIPNVKKPLNNMQLKTLRKNIAGIVL